ncbi:hypothetical protein [Microbacterium sp. YY-01]|uniref:hypothetical protein n=1 Tax=Microbacterium sp. YY-01 TaxID=3421634 RepID=UPI003D167B6B
MTESQQPAPAWQTPPPPAASTQPPPAQGAASWGTHPAPPKKPSSLGRTAFLIALAGLLISMLLNLAVPFLYSDLTPAQIGIFTTLSQLLRGIIGAVALVFGIIGAIKRAQPVLSGIAIGIAMLMLVGTMTAALTAFVYALIY